MAPESAARWLCASERKLPPGGGFLTPREREVIELRFGLRGVGASTLREAAAVIGVSRERIRQIELRALMKLRELL